MYRVGTDDALSAFMRTILLSLVLLLSTQVSAQDAERAAALSAPTATIDDDPAPSRLRVFGGALLGGAAATGASVGSSALLGFALYRRCEPSSTGWFSEALECSFAPAQAAVYTVGFAYAPTIAGGAALGARLAGGVGRYDLALLGSSVGTAAGFALLAGMAASDNDRAELFGIIMLPILQWIGGAIGASSGSLRRERSVGPTLSLGHDGGTLGLAGRF